MKFRKALAIFYRKWYTDSLESVSYCLEHGDEARAEYYRQHAEQYKVLIEENEKAIDFFSIKDNAFKIDSALPEEFRGYE